ncbi:hypothetical protein LXL04_037971 [Taraxacum kok-saghyz]
MKAKSFLPFVALDVAVDVCPSLIETMYCLLHLHKSIANSHRPVHPVIETLSRRSEEKESILLLRAILLPLRYPLLPLNCDSLISRNWRNIAVILLNCDSLISRNWHVSHPQTRI